MDRLYAYADSSELGDLEAQLVASFTGFAASWDVEGVLLTNVKSPLVEGEMQDWNIGLRVDPKNLGRTHVEKLLSFLAQLSRDVNLRFVVGVSVRPLGTRDICFIDRLVPDGAAGAILEVANAP